MQHVHRFNVYVRYYGEPEKKRFVAEITDDKAISLASTMVTETCIWGVRHTLVSFDNNIIKRECVASRNWSTELRCTPGLVNKASARQCLSMQIAAGTVYYEWQRGVQAGEAKKAQERQARADWEAAAEAQRRVRTPRTPRVT